MKKSPIYVKICIGGCMDKTISDKIIDILSKTYPDAETALEFNSPYELLVAVILSAQCTDKRVNMVTKELFKAHNTPEKMLSLSQEELERYIHSCGFYHAKARHILEASRDVLEKFGGKVPQTTEELKTLAGVGQKTANVVYAVAFNGQAIAVDTHVFRVSHRLGLSSAKDPKHTELDLNRLIDRDMWRHAHHFLINHGRNICHSKKPDCMNCNLKDYCEYYQNSGKKC